MAFYLVISHVTSVNFPKCLRSTLPSVGNEVKVVMCVYIIVLSEMK